MDDLDLFHDLTPPQRDAVLATEGPVLVVAAAGSGKTRVITRRIAHIIAQGIPAWQILALTFTNKAAGEMRERVHTLMGESQATRGLTVSTFHALCARLLRKYAPLAGLKPEFTIYDAGDQATLMKKVITAAGLSTSNFPPRSVLSAISNAKNDLLDAEAYAAQAIDFSQRNIAKIYSAYSQALRKANAVDFDDLLVMTARLLKSSAEVRAELQARWRYLMIDEYQDTNHAQFVIASLIAGEGRPNICVVGDPDQAIYGWRGADISNILEFEEHYPGARVITLGQNFRSTAPILAVADALIRHNTRRKHKPLFTSSAGGDRVDAVLCRDERHEARLVVDWFTTLKADGAAWRDFAVFYRTNAFSRVIEDEFRQAGVPYTIARGTAFYDREEIKNALAYLRVVANPADDISLERIINTPSRGIGDAALEKVQAWARDQDEPLLESLRESGGLPGISSRAAGGIARFIALLDAWSGGGTFMGSEISGSLADLVNRVIRESGLETMYKAQAHTSGSDADAQRLDNLDELVSSARQFEQEYDATADPSAEPGGTPPLLAMLRAYLESVALVADADTVDPSQGSVTLMTLHAAKGLEFHAVAIIGAEEGTLPHMRSFDSEASMEEERRLLFVGITRAMRRLLITSALYRTHRGLSERTVPSRFLRELPDEHLAVRDQAQTRSLGVDTGIEDYDPDAADPHAEHDQRIKTIRRGSAPARTPPRPTPASEFPVGSRVRHPQFGMGEVVSITGGMNARAVIAFRDIGTKTLILEYARLTRVQ